MKTIIRKLNPVLVQLGLKSGQADLRVVGSSIALRSVRKRRRGGWAAASERLAQEGDAPLWPGFSNAEDEALSW
jgi:antitoxin MazE